MAHNKITFLIVCAMLVGFFFVGHLKEAAKVYHITKAMLAGHEEDVDATFHVVHEKSRNHSPAGIRQSATDGADTSPGSSWFETQSLRKQLLKKECDLNPSLKSNLTNVIHNQKGLLRYYVVDDTYKIMYGSICKVGSTHWKSVFLVLNGKFKSVDEVPLQIIHTDPSVKTLDQYSPAEIEHRLRNYTTFIFVRDPLSRVLSAYRNKLEEKNTYYQPRVGSSILKMYRKNPTSLELTSGVGVTFAEFLRFITERKEGGNVDHHWRPSYQMIFPCNIRYDYIGKLERGKEDSENILRLLKIDHLVRLRDSTKNKSHTEKTLFNKYYKNIKQDYITKLYEMYAPDFKLFGYSMDTNLTQRKILAN
ncbi:carbohydrate sulfotransferase 11-like [Lytechinus pictus]|uniref:carbohydrate sulfotransferase 11-like n=1 Tax=Lytechinus pictus TaxID=7653 RepID=UPI0030BA24B3